MKMRLPDWSGVGKGSDRLKKAAYNALLLVVLKIVLLEIDQPKYNMGYATSGLDF